MYWYVIISDRCYSRYGCYLTMTIVHTPLVAFNVDIWFYNTALKTVPKNWDVIQYVQLLIVHRLHHDNNVWIHFTEFCWWHLFWDYMDPYVRIFLGALFKWVWMHSCSFYVWLHRAALHPTPRKWGKYYCSIRHKVAIVHDLHGYNRHLQKDQTCSADPR